MIEKIEQDLIQAMKARDERRTATLKMLKSALTNAKIAAKGELNDEVVIAVLQRESKQRLEAAELYAKAGEADRAANEQAEQAIIQDYLPAPLSEDEINTLIDEAVAATGATSPAQMGAVMGWLRPKTAGRTDGAQLAQRVKDHLS